MLEEYPNVNIPSSPPSGDTRNEKSSVVNVQNDTHSAVDHESLPGIIVAKNIEEDSNNMDVITLPFSREPSSQNTDPSSQLHSASVTSLQEIPLDTPSPPPQPTPPPLPKSPVKDKQFIEAESSSSRASLPQPSDPIGKPTSSSQPRSASLSSNTSTHHRSLTMSQGNTLSVVFISSALETIASSKEAKKLPELRDSVQHALDMIKAGQGGDRPRDIFQPLKLACETRNEKLMIASLDCISKLISHSFFVENIPSNDIPTSPTSPEGTHSSNSLADLVANTITSAYTESIPDQVSLQIVKALLALVLSSTVLIHHSSLLKAVRTVYNVFLLSQDSVNQMVAQGGLTQMVHHVFARCKSPEALSSKPNGNADSALSSRRDSVIQSPQLPSVRSPQTESSSRKSSGARPSVQINRSDSIDSNSEVAPVSQTILATGETETEVSLQISEIMRAGTNGASPEILQSISAQEPNNTASLDTFEEPNGDDHMLENDGSIHHLTDKDLFVKDAFLVFRALCKLTMKTLNTESEKEMKSHAMRSKLLSLHLVVTILNSHMDIFTDPHSIMYSSSSNETTHIIHAVKQYLCLTITRNAVSLVPQPEIEVLLNEIFIPILEMRNSTLKQKTVILNMLLNLCQDPQALVELYLNYDCDDAAGNIYERRVLPLIWLRMYRLMNVISKLGTSHFPSTKEKAPEPMSPQATSRVKKTSLPPSLSTNALSSTSGQENVVNGVLTDTKLKRQSLECLAAVLRSLVVWGTQIGKTVIDPTPQTRPVDETKSEVGSPRDRSSLSLPGDVSRTATPDVVDDPGRFESAKQKKIILLEGIRKFNFKPKSGMQFLLETGSIPSRSPQDIANFLLHTDGLSKAMIGEYLGEARPPVALRACISDEENVTIMHTFVDLLDFTGMPFTDALRLFLQSFRLPGEAQKIDRFMLKFAERFVANNPSAFTNADTAYVLAYSVILLNTDAFNPQVKHRMTKSGFIKNNRGINDGQDLPDEFLSDIYDDILSNEIRMKDEIGLPATPSLGLAGALANVGRDLQKEAYVLQSHNLANKSEALFKTLMKAQRKGYNKASEQFFSASHFIHCRPMFEVAWMPFLAGISAPLQDTDDMETVELCLDAFKNAIHIVCFFDLELERNAFVTTLAKFTFLNNLGEMKAKNMEAIKTLLDVAIHEGNHLRGSWREVLTCVSQLERMQLISSGIDVPDSKKNRMKKPPNEALANESRSTHITVAADMVFSLSHHLSGSAIVEFVQALSDVSWEEILSSGLSEHPRLFSLQKLVEISYYNMNRIRLEWSNLWAILGEHFNQVCCHNNPNVGFFALDALRQLAMRFLEIEELSHFKFQKDFLKPFEYTMIHNANPAIRDMILTCLQQMIQARVHNLRSGWRTMLGVFSAASKALTEDVVTTAFEIVTRLNRNHFVDIVRYGAFADFTVCITDFSKCSKFQKTSLLAIAMLREIIPTMTRTPECALDISEQTHTNSTTADDPMIRFWFPTLFSFYDIIMNGEDLEVRRLALDSLFATLKTYGSSYPVGFWDTVCQEILFPIFAVLRSRQDVSRFNTQEDMSVWLSTTMIQALRDLIDLYTFYFESLERFLDGLLDLLCVCICQENDTLSRIGASCLQQLVESNVQKLSPDLWNRIIATFVRLFKTTTPHQLFDESLRTEIEGTNNEHLDNGEASKRLSADRNDQAALVNERRRIFKQIIGNCVLQLLLIESTHELLQNQEVYSAMPPEYLFDLIGQLDHSYQFARSFNEDKELRTGLWKVGFMKHLPNLLKQESTSAATLISVLIRLYKDPRIEGKRLKEQVTDRLTSLGLNILGDFIALKPENQAKTIATWTPVIVEVLNGFNNLDDQTFTRYLPAFYSGIIEILSREMPNELRGSVRSIFMRIGRVYGIIEH
ncbi:hypothetical protein Clacol_001804 [Clathrus columnatus]|uniref:SEC7 domain-containing protein n=1 Tax=Clathrus columnatus TaxID=1419009 RepID=A0AAV5A3K6_9AGAM|nr:hypothetical protein Clacol_001804 [Clathrus columnatus]